MKYPVRVNKFPNEVVKTLSQHYMFCFNSKFTCPKQL